MADRHDPVGAHQSLGHVVSHEERVEAGLNTPQRDIRPGAARTAGGRWASHSGCRRECGLGGDVSLLARLVPRRAVFDVGLFKGGGFLVGEVDVECGDCFGEMVGFGRADDGG